ncbi:MAG: amylo-alpha-1,6-glucosidase, partial [Chloroflexota bacterium]
MKDLIRRTPRVRVDSSERESLLTREWLVTNGLGGYASGTAAGVCTRRYHGLLIASLPAPLGRMDMLSHLSKRVVLPDGTSVTLGGQELVGSPLDVAALTLPTEFRLESGLPVWRYQVGRWTLEKRIFMPHLQNTVYLIYRLISGTGKLWLELTPHVNFRSHEAAVNTPLSKQYLITGGDGCYELSANPDLPALRICLYGENPALTIDGKRIQGVRYREEESRGYEASGDLWSPGYIRVELSKGNEAALVGSTERWETMRALSPDEALAAELERRAKLLDAADPRVRSGFGAELTLAADQFIIVPAGRIEDSARAQARGDEVRSVIAGYHWFTDWGRDTMISLEGLTLTTGRNMEAGYILRTFAHYVRDGLIPNMFPEGKLEGLYHTADATFWFFHAIDRYLESTGDRKTLRQLLPVLLDIIDHHLKGTRFGIGVDPEDGLLRQGAEGYQLTWMDAKMGDWVVTPRRGKAVEINALWYNALRLLERWVRDEYGEEMAEPLAQHASRVRRSFNARFWYEDGGYL